ncbi:cytochrome c biogenesis protein ResB [Aquabacterium sp. J223]|nr:cytochrome c biogenesis protein ResB [Aquabacterium sp. J223]UUX97957.1 cytochrome c biogenesis protein ResB [Aquabacterium sp. J223]
MRFAIALLTVICIASVIGTVVQQQQPTANYVNQFGPFWAELFGRVGLYTVYSTWWFLLILAFLVASTSLCIARNAPKIAADLRSTKERLREQALQAFHHKAQGRLAEDRDSAFQRVSTLLQSAGWRPRVHQRPHGVMIAARKGAANKVGYLAAHSAIVLICLGGLVDGDLVVRAQMWWQDKSVFTGGGLLRDVPAQHRLGADNPTFRANLLVPEGARAGVAVINQPRGVVLQELPFDIELTKFIVEYYDTGMPKLFASQVVIHDRETGERKAATVKVNEPAFHRGIAIYQSSFDDGGSSVTLRALPLNGAGAPFEVKGTVGGSTELKAGADQTLTLEFSGLRVINVENLGGSGAGAPGSTDVRRVDLASALGDHLGSGAKSNKPKTLRNVGPSVNYKLRDAAGQAREFHNYMLPVEVDGQRVFLAGVRDSPDQSFRYLRIPADDTGALDGWLRLRHALADGALRDQAVQRYVRRAAPADRPEMAEQLRATADRALALFAGAVPTGDGATQPRGGLQALADFLESTVPEAERGRISEVLLRVLNGCLLELAQLSRERAGLPPLPADEATQAFMTQSVISLSDSFHYPAPLLLSLTGFDQVQASVFQVARAPGKTLVYLGAVLLIIGVFAMLYVRERRLWVWLEDGHGGGSRATMALSSTRRTLDTDREFERLQQAVLGTAAAPTPAPAA